MFNRIRGLFLRYERRHRSITVPGFALHGRGQLSVARPVRGHVDRVRLKGMQLTVTGWSTAQRVVLSNASGRVEMRPDILRRDVGDALGTDPHVGFELTLPHGPGPITLTCEQGDSRVVTQRMAVRGHRMLRHRLALMGRFGAALIRLAPAIWAAARHGDAEARDRVKTGLGLEAITQAGRIAPDLFAPEPGAGSDVVVQGPVPVTIILPVFNAFDLLPDVVGRVVRHTDLPWHLIVIEDCSTDPAVRPWLRDWAAAHDGPGRIELVENAANKGFIGSVNSGLARARELGHHVILLNSDAFVPERWASRLLRPLLGRANVASVTPMSNEAEIFTVPAICAPVGLEPGAGDALDRVARNLNPDAPVVVPTGVGFCMAMHIDFLQKLPELDPVFGRGYGEEVDWCQKVRALGGRHLGQPALFVEHRGGQSFGSAAKLEMIRKNNDIIAARHMGYDAEVQDFITQDPLAGPRLALAIGWAAQAGEVSIYLAHALGGGADHYLERRVASEIASGTRAAVILRVGTGARWQIELVSAAGRVAGTTDEFAQVERLLEPISARHIVYSCGVGDRDPITLPKHLLALRRGDQDRIEVLVHDFFMLSPSYTLLDHDGRYRGSLASPRSDKAHISRRPDGETVSGAQWKAAWAPLLQSADAITVFSEDSRDQILAAHPECAVQILLRPHDDMAQLARLTRPDSAHRVIGVLGNIGYQKGAAVLADLGKRLEAVPDLDLVIVGNVDPAYMPPASVTVHGDYQINDLPRLVAQYGITDWLIPSVWPETFSYTTHECLATGLPTYGFDIGAQGTAIRATNPARVIPFDPDGDLAEAVLTGLRGA